MNSKELGFITKHQKGCQQLPKQLSPWSVSLSVLKGSLYPATLPAKAKENHTDSLGSAQAELLKDCSCPLLSSSGTCGEDICLPGRDTSLLTCTSNAHQSHLACKPLPAGAKSGLSQFIRPLPSSPKPLCFSFSHSSLLPREPASSGSCQSAPER